jgi:peptidoglycan/xylan/chitin deacetylase (PgdA/CDA1 family)
MIRKAFLLTFALALVLINVGPARAQGDGDGWDYVERVTHIPILMYHYIDTPPAGADALLHELAVKREDFEKQMQWLKDQGYESISPDQLIAALWHGTALPKKPVMLTFDDGYANAWYNAYPVLLEFGYTGTFFVVTDWLDENKPGYLTWDLARAMIGGGMFIQSHSRSHLDLRNRSHEWYQNQIVKSIQAIEEHTGVRPRFFCYPYGGYDNVAIRELRAAGIVAAFTENDSRYEYASNTMRLPRVRIRGDYTFQQFIGAVTENR